MGFTGRVVQSGETVSIESNGLKPLPFIFPRSMQRQNRVCLDLIHRKVGQLIVSKVSYIGATIVGDLTLGN